jgi:N-hydroxyarylamine O-acetyltransferase
VTDPHASNVDVDAYMARIGYRGDLRPTLATLAEVVLGHTLSIAFENIDPFLRRPVRLDAASLQSKLVAGGRGGYCFEHNALLRLVLDALGYRTAGLVASVLWNRPPGPPPAPSHMLMRVDGLADTAFVVDVGFGGTTPTAPLRIEPGLEQETPHEPFRLTADADGDGDDLRMEAKVGERWQPLYRFGLEPQPPAVYEAANHRISTSLGSHFVTGLMASRPAPGRRRYALRGRELTVHQVGAESVRRLAASPGDILRALEEDFLVDLSGVPELVAALVRLW